jgi:integrase/recombinase XerC
MVVSWERSLRARNLAPKTVTVYGESARQFTAYLAGEGVDDPGKVTKTHAEEFLTGLLERRSAATASVRFRALQQWFKWMVEEGEVDASPLARMRPPVVPESPVVMPTDDQLRALLASCAGRDFVSRRDNAILRTFIDTGARLAEVANLTLEDVDLDEQVLYVTGKGRRERRAPFGRKTTAALDTYVRARTRHPQADEDALWLGEKGRGPMTDNGVAQMVRRRARALGFELHPHALRHGFAHRWRVAGGGDDELMRLLGWKSRQMLNRYGASAADERAREMYRRFSPGDRL